MDMEKLIKTAEILDRIFKILDVIVKVAAIFIVVGLFIIATSYLFGLPPAVIGSGWESVDFGFVSIVVEEPAVPELDRLLGMAAIEFVLGLIALAFAHLILKCVRNILAPMMEGAPFHDTVSCNLRKLAKYTLFLGIEWNCGEILNGLLTIQTFDLSQLLTNDMVNQVTFHYQFDLGFLLVSAVFLLLSYIFRYGEELQRLSDETL